MSAPSVIVTEAEERSALAACRCLHAAGYTVAAASSHAPAPSHWSRAVAERIALPDAWHDEAGFVEALARELRRRNYGLIVPGSDVSLLALSRARERLERLLPLALPDHEVVLQCTDKVQLLELSAEVGLDAPPSAVCVNEAEGVEAARGLGYPVVLKPKSSVTGRGAARHYRSVAVVADDSELARELPDFGLPFIVQRYEPEGTVHSFAGVFAEGRLLAQGLARYVRTTPARAGSAAFAESVEVPADLAERVGALVGTSGWAGVFELELLRLPDGRFASIDLNPRIYGSMTLLQRAGANLPAIWYEHVLGHRLDGTISARAGVCYRFDDAELRRLFRDLTHGRLSDAAAVARPRRNTACAYFRWDDPGPFAARLIELAIAGRARRRGKRAQPDGFQAGAGAVTGLHYALAYLVAMPIFGFARLEQLARRRLSVLSRPRSRP